MGRTSYSKVLRSWAKSGVITKETLTKREEIFNKSKSARITKRSRSKDDSRDSVETIEVHLVETLEGQVVLIIVVEAAVDMTIDKTPDVVTIQDAIETLQVEAAEIRVIQVEGENQEEIDSPLINSQ